MARRRGDAGQSIVELAMVLPILLLIVLGCLDLGRVYSTWMALANGTREGARYASEEPGRTATQVVARAKQDMAAQGLDLSASSLYVTAEWPNGQDCGNNVVVRATYTLPIFTTYLFGGKPLKVRASSQMMMLGCIGGY
jgi:Flp pilus assembly protein TadG